MTINYDLESADVLSAAKSAQRDEGTYDFRITDPISDPPGVTDSLYLEKCLRLPEVAWVYAPPTDAPDVSPLPASTRKSFTFGCLNNSAKISDRCLENWAKLIQSLPGTRLVLLAGQSQSAQKRLSERFMKAGILRDRIQLVSWSGAGDREVSRPA